MENEPIIEELNKKTNNEYKFMLKSALLKQDADFCVIEIFYRDGVILSDEKKQEFSEILNGILPKKFKYEFKFIKNFISTDRIEGDFKNIMDKSFPSISYSLQSVETQEYLFEISVVIDRLSYQHAIQKNLCFMIEKELKNRYEDYEFKCVISEGEVFKEDEKELLKQNYKEDEVDIFEPRKIEVSEKEILLGEEIVGPACYIKDKTSPEENVVLCGKIKGLREIVIKRKQKENIEDKTTEKSSESEENSAEENQETTSNNEKSEENGTKYQRKMFKWTLEDFTGNVSAVFFSNKENQPVFEKVADGMSVIARGKLEIDKYSGDLSFVVKDLSVCKLPEKFEEVIIYKKEKPFYEFVEPEKYVEYKQDDLMSFMVEETVPPLLADKTYVCFDFETTGLHFEAGDKIIEIGAVKIENGKITQKFMSYVDPEKPIPPESSAISGIVDSDVAGAPKDYEVLQDFYKFTRGATLIGYNNINFDNVFLIGQGKQCRWDFASNPTDDVYRYAQKYVHGVKNYRLGTIAAKLGVTLDNAHRAVFDALATAEVFIKLAKMIN